MTALIFSLVLIAYIIIPGILFRRVFHMCVPLRRIQWSRTDELTFFVVTIIVPFLIASLLVRHYEYFSHHPFGFADSPNLKWNDYKDVLSASYSEKFFDEHRLQLLDTIERACLRQCHFLAWYYAATLLWASLCGFCAYHYGNIRNWRWRMGKWFAFLLERLAIPVISEWHAMFTPYTFAHAPERWVQVDALSNDGILYQGEAGLFHVGNDGQLSGFFLKNAKRFMRAEYAEAKKLDKTTPKDKYWRQIPGETFFLPADKISNFNFTYIPKARLDALAEENLKKMNITASVTIQPATVTVEVPEVSVAEVSKEPTTKQPETIAIDSVPRVVMQSNFIVCRHCIVNGRPGRLPRVSADTPVVSRSDGRSYHLFLLAGPRLQPSPERVGVPGQYLAHFRYTLDSKNIFNEPVTVLIDAESQSKNAVLEKVEAVADRIAKILEGGKRPWIFYKLDTNSNFTEIRPPRGSRS